MERVVISGLGLISALGPDLRSTWPRLVAGESGIRRITHFDADQYSCKVAAEIDDIPCSTGLAEMPAVLLRRSVRLLTRSALEAWADAGLTPDPHGNPRWGIAAGASVNYLNMGWLTEQFRLRRPGQFTVDMAKFAASGSCAPHLFYRGLGDMHVAAPAKMLGLAGPATVIDTACATSAFAISDAYRRLQRGEVDLMVAGGATAVVNPIGILMFSLLGALSSNPNPDEASRPFDYHRDGFVMGEAGGAIVLERLEHAQARGARIYAELVGVGMTMSAVNLTDPSPDGLAEAEAMRLALEEAVLEPELVDYVAAHGTSTAKNDVVETRAIKLAFGPQASRLMVSSNKGQLGHTIAAAGVCNVICAAKALTEGVVPPTAHLRTPDPVCDLDYVPHVGRSVPVRVALANVFAFGGQNASIAIKQFE